MEILYIIPAILVVLAAIIIIRTILFVRAGGGENLVHPYTHTQLEIDPATPAEHLSAAIKIQTISHEDPAQNVTANPVRMRTRYPSRGSIRPARAEAICMTCSW